MQSVPINEVHYRNARLGLGFIVFNATFNNISVIYRGGQFCWWRKPEDPEKTTDLSPVIDKLYHIMLYMLIAGIENGTLN
jgi:hypothetical protein